MSTIEKKEYRWAKPYLYGELVGGIFFGFFALSYLLIWGDRASFRVIILFSVLSVLFFQHFFFLIIKGFYIQVTNDGIHISPRTFLGRAKDISWDGISEIKKINRRRGTITLSLLYENDFTIKLRFLKRDDRDSLIQIIKEKIENKIGLEEKD